MIAAVMLIEAMVVATIWIALVWWAVYDTTVLGLLSPRTLEAVESEVESMSWRSVDCP